MPGADVHSCRTCPLGTYKVTYRPLYQHLYQGFTCHICHIGTRISSIYMSTSFPTGVGHGRAAGERRQAAVAEAALAAAAAHAEPTGA